MQLLIQVSTALFTLLIRHNPVYYATVRSESFWLADIYCSGIIRYLSMFTYRWCGSSIGRGFLGITIMVLFCMYITPCNGKVNVSTDKGSLYASISIINTRGESL